MEMQHTENDSIRTGASQTPEAKEARGEFRPFTDEERKTLEKHGAIIYTLTGETIESQKEAERSFLAISSAGDDGLLRLPSLQTEVAIFPHPKRFFIPKSGGKDLATQELLAQQNSKALRKELGLKDDSLNVIIPEQASTLTELTFRHLEKTGVWLFGKDYGGIYARTKNPVDKSGLDVAIVGRVGSESGLRVLRGSRGGGELSVCIVRLVVAKKK